MAKLNKLKVATEHDRYVGQRIREARLAAKITQMDLADMLGTSYQQLQKYESGENRTPSASLARATTALNRPLNWFFPNLTDVRAAPAVSALFSTKKGVRFASDFTRLPPAIQDSIADLVSTIAKEHA